jgi:hypothetical protein
MSTHAKVVQVIKVISTTGDGTNKNPVREIIQYWDFDGNLIATIDDFICSIDPQPFDNKDRCQ